MNVKIQTKNPNFCTLRQEITKIRACLCSKLLHSEIFLCCGGSGTSKERPEMQLTGPHLIFHTHRTKGEKVRLSAANVRIILISTKYFQN